MVRRTKPASLKGRHPPPPYRKAVSGSSGGEMHEGGHPSRSLSVRWQTLRAEATRTQHTPGVGACRVVTARARGCTEDTSTKPGQPQEGGKTEGELADHRRDQMEP